MKTFSRVKLELLFDPAEAWQHTYQFESDFSDFLKVRGLQGQKVKTVEGGVGDVLLLISKVDPC